MLPGLGELGAFSDLPVLLAELLGVRCAVVASHFLDYLNDGAVSYWDDYYWDEWSSVNRREMMKECSRFDRI